MSMRLLCKNVMKPAGAEVWSTVVQVVDYIPIFKHLVAYTSVTLTGVSVREIGLLFLPNLPLFSRFWWTPATSIECFSEPMMFCDAFWHVFQFSLKQLPRKTLCSNHQQEREKCVCRWGRILFLFYIFFFFDSRQCYSIFLFLRLERRD